MIMVKGFELEVLDSNMMEFVEDEVAHVPGLCKLSMNAFLGKNSPTTTKVRGWVGSFEVLIMLDSGETQNFISPSTITRAKVALTKSSDVEVSFGTGISVDGFGICRNVTFQLVEYEFHDDFIAL